MKPDFHKDKSTTIPTAAAQSPQTSESYAQPSTPFNAEQWSHNFDICLKLLAGPTDEKRFVGLLLAVRLLPQGGVTAIRKVIDALGWRFVIRLLLPLSKSRSPPSAAVSPSSSSTPCSPCPQQQHQIELTCGLGLSILSAACQLPDLAGSQHVLDLIPMLAEVVAQGGVGPKLGLRACSTSSTAASKGCMGPSNTATAQGPDRGVVPAVGDHVAEINADAASVCKALESLLAVGDAGGKVGRALLLEGGTLAACTAEVERLVWACRQGAAQQRAQVVDQGEGSSWHRGMLAARLLGLLLGAEQQGDQSKVQDHEQALCAAVPALGHVLGMPIIVANKLYLDQKQQPQQQQQQQQPQMAGQAAQGLATDSIPVASSSNTSRTAATTGAGVATTAAPVTTPAGGEWDGAMLQLECLHTLLLLLPLIPSLQRLHAYLQATAYCKPPSAQQPVLGRSNVCKQASGTSLPQQYDAAGHYGWALAVQRGLGWMLRSRTGATQKHSALQLTAAMTELLGPKWLTHQPPPPSLTKPPRTQEVPFLCVLSEILHVECSLLLHDALHAQAPVWGAEPGQRGQTRDSWQPPQPSSFLMQELEEKAQVSMDADNAGDGGGTFCSQTPSNDAELLSCADARPLHERYAAAQQAQQAPVLGASSSQKGGGLPMADGISSKSTKHGSPSAAPATECSQVRTAGKRAAHMLPVVLALVEAVVEALACDAAAADEAEGSLSEEGGGGCMDAAAAQQVMAALQRTIAEVVAFLEVVAELEEERTQAFLQQQQQGGGEGCESMGGGMLVTGSQRASQQSHGQEAQGASMQEAFDVAAKQKPPSAVQLVEGVHVPESMQARMPAAELLLACVRVVGRFLADVPDGHTPAMRRALPFMLTVAPSVSAASTEASVQGTHSRNNGHRLMPESGPDSLGGEGSSVRFLLPGLLQATATPSPKTTDLYSHITSSPAALASLLATLTAACQQATSLASTVQGLAPPATAEPAQARAGSEASHAPKQDPAALKHRSSSGKVPLVERLQGLASAEQLLADVAMLLINLVDPTQAPPVASQHQDLIGDGPHLSLQPSSHATSSSLLGPATRALLLAVVSLATWAECRGISSLLAGNGSVLRDNAVGALLAPEHVVALLSHARLKPRTLLCGGYLCALVLHAATQQAEAVAGQLRQGGVGDRGACSSLASLLQGVLPHKECCVGSQQPMDIDEDGKAHAQHTLHSAATLITCALQLGTSLVCGLVIEEANPGECITCAAASSRALSEASLAASGDIGVVEGSPVDGVLADMCGDGESCFERLAYLVGHQPSLALLVAQGEASLPQRRTLLQGWLVQLFEIQAGRAGKNAHAFREVIAQSMGLRLLLASFRS